MLGLGGFLGSLLSLLLGGLLLGSSLLLGLLGLLRSDVGELGSVEELELGRHSRVDGLVVDGLVPTRDVGVLLAELLVEEELEAAGNGANGEQIGQSDALTDQVSVVLEVLLNGGNSLQSNLGGVVDVFLVVGVTANQGAVPLAQVGKDLGLL